MAKKGTATVEFRPNLKDVQRAIKSKVKEMMNLTPANHKVAIFLDRWVQKNFMAEGGPVGGWTPFKIGGRRMPGGGIDRSAKLLQNTGRLRNSFQPFWNKQIAGVGSTLSYSTHHEHGTSRIPQRRILPVQSEVIGGVLKIFSAHVQKISGGKLW